MNFFAQQERARILTFRLILLLCAAVACLILITTLALALFMYFFETHASSIQAVDAYSQNFSTHLIRLLQSKYFLWIIGGTTLTITAGSFFKYIQIQRGGEYIAQALGGLPITSETQNKNEKRVLNVVEEMAIASGIPVPKVYLLEEKGINAFAAGNDWQHAIIGVTRGCIDNLSRDELQGVIAHEFSHIFNGDMRLNLRLIAILHGILLIGLLGELIVHSSGRRHRNHNSSNKNNSRGQLIAVGIALVVIGYAGVFFGNLIKAAVSRQREFLADASAVQYTRNPLGIGGALNRIEKYQSHSHISHEHSAQFSHMYFADGLTSHFSKISNIFATHPPLKTRLERIFPRGIPPFELATQHHKSSHDKKTNKNEHKTGLDKLGDIVPLAVAASTNLSNRTEHNNENHSSNNGGYSGENHSFGPHADTSALDAWQSIPEVLLTAARSAFSARAVIYSLLLDKNIELKAKQIEHLKKSAHPRTYQVFIRISQDVNNLKSRQYLPLFEICLNSLKDLSTTQRDLFIKNAYALTETDGKTSLFEWCIIQRIELLFTQDKKLQNKTLTQCQQEIYTILTIVSQATHSTERQKALNKGLKLLMGEEQIPPTNKKIHISHLKPALNTLNQLKPLAKPQLLNAVRTVMEYDSKITESEEQLFRILATTLSIPSTI